MKSRPHWKGHVSCGGELFLSQSMISRVEMAKPVVSLEQLLPFVANIEEYRQRLALWLCTSAILSRGKIEYLQVASKSAANGVLHCDCTHQEYYQEAEYLQAVSLNCSQTVKKLLLKRSVDINALQTVLLRVVVEQYWWIFTLWL